MSNSASQKSLPILLPPITDFTWNALICNRIPPPTHLSCTALCSGGEKQHMAQIRQLLRTKKQNSFKPVRKAKITATLANDLYRKVNQAQHRPADRDSVPRIYRRVKTPNRTGASQLFCILAAETACKSCDHTTKNLEDAISLALALHLWVTIEYVLKISLVKIGLNSSTALIWPVVLLGPFPPSLKQLLPPPFRAITLQGYSAYVFPNLFQTWLWLRLLFLLLRSFSDWRLLQRDENHLNHSLLLTTWQTASALYWSQEDVHVMATSSTSNLSMGPMVQISREAVLQLLEGSASLNLP